MKIQATYMELEHDYQRVEGWPVHVEVGDAALRGNLSIPPGADRIVVFVHGSGSTRHSPRNRFVAEVLFQAGFAVLLFDLLTPEEEGVDVRTRHLRFDIDLLTRRTIGAMDWLQQNSVAAGLDVGLFGASTGAAAALQAAVERPEEIAAVVSRGGRPDMVEEILPDVMVPTLLIVGENDSSVVGFNRNAYGMLRCEKRLEIIPGASHLFEESGALEQVAEHARNWFLKYMRK